EYIIENAFQELYNIHIEEEEKENINETENQLNINLDKYIDKYYLDDNK
ncbi:27033_t:CDS:1, partial [Gigaspora margarita]